MNKRVLMVVGMALVLFVSVLLVAPSAMAQGPGEGFQPGRGGSRGGGMGPRMGDREGTPYAPPRAHLETMAEALGMTTEELVSELQGGKTIAEVAEAQGVDLDTVVDAVLAEIEERLDTLVEDGRLTQEQADERLENARERVTERMNQTHTPGDRNGFARPDMPPPPRAHLETMAEALGMTTEELVSELQGGKTIAEVAEAQGVDLDTVVDAVLAEIEERLDTLVEDGRLTQEQADERLENARERVTERMNNSRPPAGMGPGAGMADESGAGSFQRPGRGMFRP